MNCSRAMLWACLIGATGLHARGQIHAGDISLSVSAWNRLRTGGSDVSGNPTPGVRVFSATFGLAPNFTNNPGFDCAFGTFVAGTPIGFNIRSALREWDDAGSNFDVIPTERVQVKLGPLGPILTPLADQIVPGFSINAGADGKYHHHYGYTLLAPAGSGVYLVELEMAAGDGTLETSRPFYMVFNQNRPADEHTRALEWVASHYACPADVNDDRSVDLGDFFDFLNAFDQNLGLADINSDDQVDLTDFFGFLNGFDSGC